MDTYAIFRRGGWRTQAELEDAAARSRIEGDRVPDEIRWIRSYVLAERDGTVGTVCIYQASSPEAIRAHAAKADLPVDEIVAVSGLLRLQPDPEPATV
jgi:Protein of unknown function (DUF4242)